MSWPGLMEVYKEYLPVTKSIPNLKLIEGNTPIIKIERFSNEWDDELSVKTEGADPTDEVSDEEIVVAYHIRGVVHL
jgi:threonine synthase